MTVTPPGSAGQDARLVAKAINRGWIARGFMLGIGFWLSGLAIAAAAVAGLAVLGLSVNGLTHLSDVDYSSAVTSPPDPRNWREQLRANDEAAAEMKRELAARKMR